MKVVLKIKAKNECKTKKHFHIIDPKTSSLHPQLTPSLSPADLVWSSSYLLDT